jgi:uncharacterized protein
VVLAHLLAEDRQPPESLWQEPLISSRLLEYEVWTRISALRLSQTHSEITRAVIDRLALLELAPTVLARAVEAFPVAVRTLDALHLASIEFLRGRGHSVELATYDDRLIGAARALDIRLLRL